MEESIPFTDPERAVRVAYAAAGFPASEEDVARAIAAYPIIRGIADMLYGATVGSEVGPAFTYSPTDS